MKVTVYSTPTCPYCKMVKEYLSSKNVAYTDVNVAQDEQAAREMVKMSGQMGVPVVCMDQEIIVGFDKKRIDQVIARS